MKITQSDIVNRCKTLGNINIIDFIYFDNVNTECIVQCECGRVHKVKKCINLYRVSHGKLYFICDCKKKEKIFNRYKELFNSIEDYELIDVYLKGDVLNNKTINKAKIKIKHKYCNNIHYIEPYNFFNRDRECVHCCGSYENSFAYYIEQELREPLDKYWDFEKNTVNPYHISKNRNAKNSKGENTKVWIKCTEKDYHESYEISCNSFVAGNRCSYCGSHKTHPKDSFAQYHIDNTDKDFLTKYWSDKNAIDPWTISPYSHKKVWLKCQEKDYHNDNGGYEINCANFTNGNRCPYCNTFASKKVHPLDSFGYKHFDKAQSWHPDNKISPFRVAPGSNKKYKFICPDCDHVWSPYLSNILRGCWCPECSTSKGEKRILSWLKLNNINYKYNEEYFDNLKGINDGTLRPDFILPDHKIWIEYDGEFHYENIYDGCNYETLKIHDKKKNKYAKEHGWKLIRIPYWDFNNIEEVLNKHINNNAN